MANRQAWQGDTEKLQRAKFQSGRRIRKLQLLTRPAGKVFEDPIGRARKNRNISGLAENVAVPFFTLPGIADRLFGAGRSVKSGKAPRASRVSERGSSHRDRLLICHRA